MSPPPSHTTLLLLTVSLLSLFISPSLSLKCQSQKLKTTYKNCLDLPQLNAYLHYTYNATSSSLSIAYLAPSKGWIAWAINPTATGMVGSQALFAIKSANGSLIATTYNISGYHGLAEGKLAFDVWDLKAEEADGLIRIYASVKVPEKATAVNQVWQVGDGVNGTKPSMHLTDKANLESKGVLPLVATSAGGGGGGGAVSPAAAPALAPHNGGFRMMGSRVVGLVLCLVLFVLLI